MDLLDAVPAVVTGRIVRAVACQRRRGDDAQGGDREAGGDGLEGGDSHLGSPLRCGGRIASNCDPRSVQGTSGLWSDRAVGRAATTMVLLAHPPRAAMICLWRWRRKGLRRRA